mmetsp:Transcript_67720/g.159491  ORF Transcript_67720/g.159491 Transcript_67720/m.159491 type:complete len:268 (-) Transcript_67720:25-828(-)
MLGIQGLHNLTYGTFALTLGVALIQRFGPPNLVTAYGRHSEAIGSVKGILGGLTRDLPGPPSLWWFLMESPAFFIPLYLVAVTKRSLNPTNFAVLSLFLLHYFNRALIYPTRIKSKKPMPIAIVLSAGSFCTLNGVLQATYLIEHSSLEPNDVLCFRGMTGVVLFFAGLAINIQADSILTNLRKPGETGYKIPHGGLFRFVSGANYFGESLEWVGFALVCNSLPSVAFAVFTANFLGSRACNHHRWYQNKFKEQYPPERKAFIPFLF